MFQFTIRLDRTVLGIIAVGIIVAISSLGIGRAERVRPAGSVKYACSSGTACVEGDSTGSKTWAVYGVSTGADGVHGVTSSTNGNSAVAGIATGTSGNAQGVFGKSSNGYGVSGFSTAPYGSNSAGVYGKSSHGYGVYGVSAFNEGVYGSGPAAGVYGSGNTYGVYGYSKYHWGVYAESATSDAEALYAQGDGSATILFYAVNAANSDAYCQIDPNANLTCSGKIGASGVREQHRNSGGQHVLTYASQSATATIEDVGTARMHGGIANVRIDPAFASLTDGRWYYVFLTPLGDTRGLYVSMKTSTGFQVRETEHGRSSLEFDYRIVAHPLDAGNDRLPPAPEIHRLSVRHPRQ